MVDFPLCGCQFAQQELEKRGLQRKKERHYEDITYEFVNIPEKGASGTHGGNRTNECWLGCGCCHCAHLARAIRPHDGHPAVGVDAEP